MADTPTNPAAKTEETADVNWEAKYKELEASNKATQKALNKRTNELERMRTDVGEIKGIVPLVKTLAEALGTTVVDEGMRAKLIQAQTSAIKGEREQAIRADGERRVATVLDAAGITDDDWASNPAFVAVEEAMGKGEWDKAVGLAVKTVKDGTKVDVEGIRKEAKEQALKEAGVRKVDTKSSTVPATTEPLSTAELKKKDKSRMTPADLQKHQEQYWAAIERESGINFKRR